MKNDSVVVGHTVTLGPEDLWSAAYMGLTRYYYALTSKALSKAVRHEAGSSPAGWQHAVDRASAHFAVGRYLGVKNENYYHGVTEADRVAGKSGMILEARCFPADDKLLFLAVWQDEDGKMQRPFVAVRRHTATLFELVGWLFGHQIREIGDPGHTVSVGLQARHVAHEGLLQQPEELRELVTGVKIDT